MMRPMLLILPLMLAISCGAPEVGGPITITFSYLWGGNFGNGVGSWAAKGILEPLDAYMAKDGFDTADFVPAALKQMANEGKTYSMFLDLSEERGLGFYLGLYDSNHFWHRHDWRTEVEINRAFIAEVWERYGESGAFKGWYLPHEATDSSSLRILDINTALAEEVKNLTGLPVLISPYYMGRQDIAGSLRPRSPEEHQRVWEEIFARYEGLVDACAFQDATTDLLRLEDYTRATVEAARGRGIALWSNAETFDRDMPIRFPPTDWRKLAHRLDTVQPYVEKIISFETPHFMSPNSMWPSAQALYRRYLELVADRSR